MRPNPYDANQSQSLSPETDWTVVFSAGFESFGTSWPPMVSLISEHLIRCLRQQAQRTSRPSRSCAAYTRSAHGTMVSVNQTFDVCSYRAVITSAQLEWFVFTTDLHFWLDAKPRMNVVISWTTIVCSLQENPVLYPQWRASRPPFSQDQVS